MKRKHRIFSAVIAIILAITMLGSIILTIVTSLSAGAVTEAEIVEAVKRGARTLDGVKRRTRAGMGRCQGGFCAPRVMEIISRETGIPMEELTKFGGGSYLIADKTRPEVEA